MKYTIAVTQQCNLGCSYCYISRNREVMSLETADKIIEFMFHHTPEDETIEIGFFGGEPMLEFELIKAISSRIRSHRGYNPDKVNFFIVSNGTIFSDAIADELLRLQLPFGISCDGPPHIQDTSRVFRDGRGSSTVVEKNIRYALRSFPFLPVNAVYTPNTLQHLPEVIDYFYALGVRVIYLNPDISARWTKEHAQMLPVLYRAVGEKYIDYYKQETPCYISMIDSKVTVIMRGGYQPLEKCRMGKGEFAFAPSGNVYPCERLIGSDDGVTHCLGNINSSNLTQVKCSHDASQIANATCPSCELNQYCMNWCGCTNYFATGDYNAPGAFLCASEKASIGVALEVINTLGNEGIPFSDHLAGTPLMSIIGESVLKG
ncbi:radical SAM protein [Chlorobium sp. BLA1]|uniref:radical SAM/SPASM domain-containing protein n=1 Tax=Candidatus Chlorobium masyuteum TaxID=2716876 RepID=UPI001420098A|nr:radical SAM protein [Candidatus Chlorobium masyuteum]NHQ60774.1 radical SAM protein [Candidatus Chlorobium masyuteum]